jgi:hypothetical protein
MKNRILRVTWALEMWRYSLVRNVGTIYSATQRHIPENGANYITLILTTMNWKVLIKINIIIGK